MTWNEAIVEACRLSNTSYAALARKMGYLSASSIAQLVHERRTPSVVMFARIMDELGLSYGHDRDRGWWVCRPEEVTLPRAAE